MTSQPADCQIISPDEHGICEQQISQPALWVAHKLIKAGFDTYLVGGCVRDLLLGKRPKDFDVATSARPQQIRSVFGRGSRVIGRRFRIVHVYRAGELLEVSTFRSAQAKQHTANSQTARKSKSGVLLRDNHYGTLPEDAGRRDFTINALYFDPVQRTLHDFTGAMADLQARKLKMIGNPEERYKEDPVRMLRAARFIAKLQFKLEDSSRAPIAQLATMLHLVPSARLYVEVCKLFLTGHGYASLQALKATHLFEVLFPESASCPDALRVTEYVLKDIDDRHLKKRPLSARLLYTALLWPAFCNRAGQSATDPPPTHPQLIKAAQSMLASPDNQITQTQRLQQSLQEVWSLQLHFEFFDPSEEKKLPLASKPSFIQACAFLLLRARAENNTALYERAKHWQRYCHKNVFSEEVDSKPKLEGRKRRRYRSKSSAGRR